MKKRGWVKQGATEAGRRADWAQKRGRFNRSSIYPVLSLFLGPNPPSQIHADLPQQYYWHRSNLTHGIMGGLLWEKVMITRFHERAATSLHRE